MADIKQAAKWIEDGENVRRSSWVSGAVARRKQYKYERVHDTPDITLIFEIYEKAWPFRELMTRDLLADDWEIAE